MKLYKVRTTKETKKNKKKMTVVDDHDSPRPPKH